MLRRWNWIMVVVALGLALLARVSPGIAQDNTPHFRVAWTAATGPGNADVIAWDSAAPEPRIISSGPVVGPPHLSPDGAWVVTTRGQDLQRSQVWLTAWDGALDRVLVTPAQLATEDETRRSVWQAIWAADSRSLYFTTYAGELGFGMDARPANDLWRVALPDGIPERLLADGEGGTLALSPDGRTLALTTPGEYTQPGEPAREPGRIAFYDLSSGTRTVALAFTPVATASSWRWHPAVQWSLEGDGVYTAIAPPELVYVGMDPAGDTTNAADQLTALWWVPLDGEAQQLGAVAADFFGLPVFAPDGTQIAYLSLENDPENDAVQSLVIANADGTDATAYTTVTRGVGAFDGWLPEGHRFLFRSDESLGYRLMIGAPGADPEPFPVEVQFPAVVQWLAADTYALDAARTQDERLQSTLYVGTLAGTPQAIATQDEWFQYDALLLPGD